MADYDIGKAFDKIEHEIMMSMIRNMKRHRLEEISESRQWSMWQVEQLKALEKFKKENYKKYKGKFQDINSSIDSLLREARAQGGMEQEMKILRAMKKGFIPKKRRKGTETLGEFFKLNDRKLEALIKATTDDMEKAETAVLRMSEDQYRKIIFDAQVYANTGAGTYEKAVDMATKDFLSRGINCIQYANGARHTIATYADMAIRTAAKRAYLQGEGEMRKEWGITTVIMNKRGNACPLCLPFVGKVLIDDVWSGGSAKDGPYLLMSIAIAKGLYHPNCRDVHTTYFEGISTPPDSTFTQEELEQLKEDYQKEQKQQYAKRQAKKFERLEKFSLDEKNKRKYEQRRQIWEKCSQSITEIEHSPRKSTKGDFGVNWEVIHSPEYRKRLEQLSDNPKVIDAIEVRAKWALNNRNGLKTEELYAISLDTGKEIASILGEQIEFGVSRTNAFTRKLNAANRTKENILLIHNHPRGMPPSIGDLNALCKNKNISGITIGHDGSIYYYSRPKKEISPSDFEVAMRKYSRYTEITGIEKALEEISKQYGFEIKKI